MRAFSSCGKRRLLFTAVRGISLRWLLLLPSRLQVCGLQQLQLEGARVQARQLWPPGLVARGTWTLPRLGIEPGSPALAGRFLSTRPPGKSESHFLKFVSHGINVSTHVVDVMSINERMKDVAFHQLLFVQLSPMFRLAQLEPGGQRSITACTAVGGQGLM